MWEDQYKQNQMCEQNSIPLWTINNIGGDYIREEYQNFDVNFKNYTVFNPPSVCCGTTQKVIN